jgi:hypothetical protein
MFVYDCFHYCNNLTLTEQLAVFIGTLINKFS